MEPDAEIEQFADEIDKVFERFRHEYDLTYAAAIGVLTMKIHTLVAESQEGDA